MAQDFTKDLIKDLHAGPILTEDLFEDLYSGQIFLGLLDDPRHSGTRHWRRQQGLGSFLKQTKFVFYCHFFCQSKLNPYAAGG